MDKLQIDRGIEGLAVLTTVNVELRKGGIVKIYTDAPRSCCVAVVELSGRYLDDLIDTLLLARQLIKEGK